MNDYFLPERPLEPPEPSPVCRCDWCGKELYEGDDAYNINGETICCDCIEYERFTVEPPERSDDE